MTTGEGIRVVLSCAAVTFLLRFGGLCLARSLGGSSRFRRVLDAVPASMMLAFTVHSLRDFGMSGICGIVVAVLLMKKSGSPLMAMASGVAVVAFLRSFT